MSKSQPLRLGLSAYLEGKAAKPIYRDVRELFLTADQLGFYVGWVAQHRFDHHGGLPSPLVFFASPASETQSLGFGAAIVCLPLENAIRVAEDAALFKTLHPGRLDLGLGAGLLLSRIAIGGGDPPTPEIQAPMVDLYKRTLPAGVPAPDRHLTHRLSHLEPGRRLSGQRSQRIGGGPDCRGPHGRQSFD